MNTLIKLKVDYILYITFLIFNINFNLLEESSKEEEENQSYGSEGSEGGKKDDDKKSKIPKVPGLNAMTKIDI